MAARRFHIVDVFAERQYAGNQLAVVLDSDGLDTAAMQRIARETNFSETTFLTADAPRDGGWDVRIFTPVDEVPFAGHPTLGTAWIIREHLIGEPVETVTLNLRVGAIPVSFGADGVLWMRQRQPEFGETMPAERMAPLLGLAAEDLDPRHPVQTVSTGLPFWIAPLRDLAAVKRARADRARCEQAFAETQAKMVLLFAGEAEEPGNTLHARMFADLLGVPEDPATGSAAGCLAAWLSRHRYLGSPEVSARLEQGYEIGRPSLLRLDAKEQAGGIDIRVGGRVFAVARGELI